MKRTILSSSTKSQQKKEKNKLANSNYLKKNRLLNKKKNGEDGENAIANTSNQQWQIFSLFM